MFLTKKRVSCFSIYKTLPSWFFIAGLCLQKLHMYLVDRESPSHCVLKYTVDVREAKVATCKLVTVTFCERYRRFMCSLILQLHSRYNKHLFSFSLSPLCKKPSHIHIWGREIKYVKKQCFLWAIFIVPLAIGIMCCSVDYYGFT